MTPRVAGREFVACVQSRGYHSSSSSRRPGAARASTHPSVPGRTATDTIRAVLAQALVVEIPEAPDGRWIVARSGRIDLVDAAGSGFLRLGYTAGYLGATWKPR